MLLHAGYGRRGVHLAPAPLMLLFTCPCGLLSCTVCTCMLKRHIHDAMVSSIKHLIGARCKRFIRVLKVNRSRRSAGVLAVHRFRHAPGWMVYVGWVGGLLGVSKLQLKQSLTDIVHRVAVGSVCLVAALQSGC